ncbi:MAG: hypothetical protein WCA46_24750 [Actinocatenispora sp.]
MRDHHNEHEFTLKDSPWHLDTGFDTALRGYHRKQVRRYARRVETAMTEMATRQATAQERIRDLTAQVVKLQADLMARQREQAPEELPPTQRFGARLERMLVVAEQQAREIAEGAEQNRVEAHEDAEQARADAREEAEQTRAEARKEAETIRAGARKEADAIVADATTRADHIAREAHERAEAAILRSRRRVKALQDRYESMQSEIKTVLETVDHLATDSSNATPAANSPLSKPRKPRDDRQRHANKDSSSSTRTAKAG